MLGVSNTVVLNRTTAVTRLIRSVFANWPSERYPRSREMYDARNREEYRSVDKLFEGSVLVADTWEPNWTGVEPRERIIRISQT